MENRRKPKNVEDIIKKYGVQSISTDAAHDVLDDDSFAPPVEKPPRSEEPKKAPAPEPPKKNFTVTIPDDDLSVTQELPEDFEEQVQNAYVHRAEESLPFIPEPESYDEPVSYTEPEGYDSSESYDTTESYDMPEASDEPGDYSDSPDSFFIPDTAYYTGIFADDGAPHVHEAPQALKDAPYDEERGRYFIDDVPEKKEGAFTRFLKFLFPWKGDRTGEIIRKIIFLTALVILIVSASILIPSLVEDWRAGQTDTAVSDLYHKAGDEESIKEAEQLLGGPLPQGILPEFALLYANNQDVVGWLSVPDTELDYPIARAQDNDYYFHRNYYKEKTRYGVPFMDFRCEYNPLSENTVIYGHHMNNGTVFSALDTYKTLDGYKKHPVIKFNTLYERHEWQVFAAFITNAYAVDDDGYTFNYMINSFADENDFNGFIDAVQKRSVFATGVEVTYGDKLLTLQTCSHEFSDARLVVVARMVNEGDPEVDVDAAFENPNPIYPLAYCNKYGITYNCGPDDRWYPAGSSEQEPETETTTTEAVTTAPTTTTTTAPTTTEGATTTTTKPTTTTTTRPTTTTTTTRPTTTTTKPTTTTPTTEPTTTITEPEPTEPPHTTQTPEPEPPTPGGEEE